MAAPLPTAHVDAPKQTIEQRLARAERMNRILGVGLALLWMLYLNGRQPIGMTEVDYRLKSQDIVTPRLVAPSIATNSIDILDSEGNVAVSLGSRGRPGHGFIDVRNGENRSRSEVTANTFECIDSWGKRRVTVSGGDFVESGVFLRDTNGHTRAAFFSAEDPGFYMTDADDRTRFQNYVAGKKIIMNCMPTPDGDRVDLIP